MTTEKDPPSRKRIPPTERRSMIMDAAVESFLKKGLRGTTMQDIARSCGISIGHIYNHFDGKDSIIEAIVTQKMLDFLENVAKGWRSTASLAETCEAVTKEMRRRSSKVMQLHLEVLTEAQRNERVRKCVHRAAKKPAGALSRHWKRTAGKRARRFLPALSRGSAWPSP